MSCPSTRTEPSWIGYMPRISRLRVVLPEPLRPTMPNTDPAGIVKEISSRAGGALSL
jgi:hypothetical protein